jgi:hypothetical protein
MYSLIALLQGGIPSAGGKEMAVGSWTGQVNHLDAELPFFSGGKIRTTTSNLQSMTQAVSRNGSFSGTPVLGHDSSYSGDAMLFNSPSGTPRSPMHSTLFDLQAGGMTPGTTLLESTQASGTSTVPAKVCA